MLSKDLRVAKPFAFPARRRFGVHHLSRTRNPVLAFLGDHFPFPWTEVAILILFILLEVASIAIYIYTLERSLPDRLDELEWGLVLFRVEVVLCLLFLVQWCVALVLSPHRLNLLLSFYTVITITTALPMVVCGLGDILAGGPFASIWIPMFLRIWKFGEYLKILLHCKPFAYMVGAYQEVVKHSVALLSILFTCVGVHQIVQSTTGASVSFYDATYMMVITFSTIGYGDISPSTFPSRMVAIMYIIIGICVFIPFISFLASIGELHHRYRGFFNRNRKKAPHIILCGEFTDKVLEILLVNFYSGWRRYLSTQVIVMSPKPFSNDVLLLTDSPWLQSRVIPLVGEPSSDADLHRADAHHADAIFLYGNTSSSAFYNDYEIISQSLAVSMYDSILPQHVLLRRLHPNALTTKANVMQMERLVHNLMGMGLVLPGVVPLLVNLLRTYEAVTTEVNSGKDWLEQYEYSLRQDLVTAPIRDSLRWLHFSTLAREFYQRKMVLIGVLDGKNRVQLNRQEVIGDAKKIIVIARSLNMVVEATNEIALQYKENFGEEMLQLPHMDRYIASFTTLRQMERWKLDSSSSASSSSSDGSWSGDDSASNVNESSKQNKKNRLEPTGGLEKEKLLVQIPDAMHLSNHVVIVDLAVAKSSARESRQAEEVTVSEAAQDLLMLLDPIQKICPQNEIVILSCDLAQFSYIEGGLYKKRKFMQKPIRYIFGCGLNTRDLRRCNFNQCAGCCVFFSGDISRDGSTSAMSLMTVLSILETVNVAEGHSAPFPLMVELEGLINLQYFPPAITDSRLAVQSAKDYVFQPSYLVGNTVSRQMLSPILLRTYFVDEFLDVMNIMINGHDENRPSLGKVLLSEFETEMVCYRDVTEHCLQLGYLPLALHRCIHDPRNPALTGHRFVLTNPPPALPVHQETDAIFFLTSGSSH